jgi:hypothetical protein
LFPHALGHERQTETWVLCAKLWREALVVATELAFDWGTEL